MIILVKDDPKLQEDVLTAEVGQHIYQQDGRDYYYVCSLSDYVVLRTSHSQHSEQMTSLPDVVIDTFKELAFLYLDGLKIDKELENLFGGSYHYYNYSSNEFFFTQNCIDYSAEAVFEPWTVVLSMSKYCDGVEGAIYMDEQGVVHDLSVEDVAELGYLFKAQLLTNNMERRSKDMELKDLSNEPVEKVKPKHFRDTGYTYRAPKDNIDIL
jgi:hypothetical protein